MTRIWKRLRRFVIPLVATFAVFWVLALPAFADLTLGSLPGFPATVTVGQTFTVSTVFLTTATDPEAQGTVALRDITVIPSCSNTLVGCPGGIEAGVFAFSATGTGTLGCTQAFTITESPPGVFNFDPDAPSVPANGGNCTITYDVTVLRVPTVDVAATPGVQTNQISFATADSNVAGGSTITNGGTDQTTVLAAQPTLTTTATPPAAAGGTSTDSATLTAPAGLPPGAIAPSGTITFSLYGPTVGTPDCMGTAHDTIVVPVTAFSPPPYSSGPSTALAPGQYSWVAVYSGDQSYLGATTACNDPLESFVVAAPAPAISVDKTASPLSLPAPGGAFTFTVVVTNTGGQDLVLTALTDDVYGDLFDPANPNITNNTCDDLEGDTLAPAASTAPCSFTGQFTGVSGDSQTDTVTVEGTPPTGAPVTDTDDAIVTITPAPPSISVEKTAAPLTRIEPGGDFTFTVVVTNTGGVPLTILTLTDNIYGNIGTSADPNNTCDDLIGDVLAPGASSAPCTFVGAFTGSAGASQTDIVTVIAEDEAGTDVTDTDDAVVSLTPRTLLIQVVKTANPLSRPAPGGAFTFSVTVTNNSNVPITITELTDDIYGDLGDPANPNITANDCDDIIGDTLAPGASTSPCSFTGQFTGTAGDAQTDTVTATGVDDAGTEVTDDDDATVTITPSSAAPSISVDKSASPASRVAPGGDFTFTVIVTNTGPVALTITELTDDIYGDLSTDSNPEIDDNTCDNLIGDVLQPGQSSSPCSFVGEFEGDAGDTQTDIVTATGVTVGGQEVTDDDPAQVTLTTRSGDDDNPDLNIQVTKTASPPSRPAPGGDFTFTVVVSNDGDVELEITELVDSIYGDLGDEDNPNVTNNDCDDLIGDHLDPGENSSPCHFTGNFTGSSGASERDVVTVTGEDDEGNDDSDDDDATVTLTPGTGAPTIQVVKSASPESKPAPGGEFTFTVTVTNNSSVALTITELTDSVYGDLGRFTNSEVEDNTCDDLIDDVLQPGQSASCSFTGTFTGNAGDSETDVVRVEGEDSAGNTVTDDDDAKVTITGVGVSPSPTPSVSPSIVIVNNITTASPVVVVTPSPVPSPTPSPAKPVTPPIARTGSNTYLLVAAAGLLMGLGYMLRRGQGREESS